MERFATGTNVVHVVDDLCCDAASVRHGIVVDELMRSPALLALDLSRAVRMAHPGAGRPGVVALAAAELTELFEIFVSFDQASEESH